ncbi:hypothetical protein NPIL_666011 [Nephila pilipes]|uniref:Uncharacterized protein n=1 Tax=Nephila pilipes TaxID=299642 RepID=A0A8X6PEA8_NEPPI|nr:hypothetical protein NPIL_666011 [Nephila pilipes]
MVEEAIALMSEISDDDTFNETDIYLDKPSNEDTDEDCEQSILYAGQKGDHDFVIGAEDLKLFFAILFTSGYNVLPRRRI